MQSVVLNSSEQGNQLVHVKPVGAPVSAAQVGSGYSTALVGVMPEASNEEVSTAMRILFIIVRP
jgi:hypothetical protein